MAALAGWAAIGLARIFTRNLGSSFLRPTGAHLASSLGTGGRSKRHGAWRRKPGSHHQPAGTWAPCLPTINQCNFSSRCAFKMRFSPLRVLEVVFPQTLKFVLLFFLFSIESVVFECTKQALWKGASDSVWRATLPVSAHRAKTLSTRLPHRHARRRVASTQTPAGTCWTPEFKSGWPCSASIPSSPLFSLISHPVECAAPRLSDSLCGCAQRRKSHTPRLPVQNTRLPPLRKPWRGFSEVSSWTPLPDLPLLPLYNPRWVSSGHNCPSRQSLLGDQDPWWSLTENLSANESLSASDNPELPPPAANLPLLEPLQNELPLQQSASVSPQELLLPENSTQLQDISLDFSANAAMTYLGLFEPLSPDNGLGSHGKLFF